MLTIQFVPYNEISSLDSKKRISKLLSLAKQNKIVVLEGRLRSEEEAELIKKTMEQISSKFKGIEIAVIYPDESNGNLVSKARKGVINLLLGNRQGLTVIGPANIVTEIKKDPNKLEILTRESRARGR
ncbi:MAG: DUF2073 domain-containing protein [Candidatus Woesearchaeota archaeon]